jgi:hypothetical protein
MIFFGLKETEDHVRYIYNEHYNMKLLEARIRAKGSELVYCLHPGFWAALGIQ